MTCIKAMNSKEYFGYARSIAYYCPACLDISKNLKNA